MISQAGAENFTVASVLLGRERQRHLMAIYGFARLVDDVGDEAPGDRDALLDVVESELDRIYAGGRPSHPLMATLAGTVRDCRLPSEPLRRLIEANRRDQVVTRYETFDQLLDYCQLSAAPVGELVLHVFGAATAGADRAVGPDLRRACRSSSTSRTWPRTTRAAGSTCPGEDRERFGVGEAELASPPSAWRPLLAFEAARARTLLAAGAPLARTLPPRPRMAVAGFVAGGRRALDRLAVRRRRRPVQRPGRRRFAGGWPASRGRRSGR